MAAENRKPRVALFVTCLVDLFRPGVGFAAVKLLEQAGCAVEVPPKPQQISASRISVRVNPATLASSLRGCALTPSSRRPEQES